MREPLWVRSLDEALSALGRDSSELLSNRKGENWKVDIALLLREQHLTPYRWIVEHHPDEHSFLRAEFGLPLA